MLFDSPNLCSRFRIIPRRSSRSSLLSCSFNWFKIVDLPLLLGSSSCISFRSPVNVLRQIFGGHAGCSVQFPINEYRRFGFCTQKNEITTWSLYRAYTEKGIAVANVVTFSLNACQTQTKHLIGSYRVGNGMSYDTQEHCYQRRANAFPSGARTVEAILLEHTSNNNYWLFTHAFLFTKIIAYTIDDNPTRDTCFDLVRIKVNGR